MSDIALFGGSFDPPHLGHWQLFQLARKRCHLEKIIIMPAYQPYLKKRHLTPAHLRLEMLQKMFGREPAAVISDWEIKRRRSLSTYYTWRCWQKKFPGKRLFILVGSDSFNQIPHWKNGRKLLQKAQFIVGRRPGYCLSGPDFSAIVLPGRFPDISSTAIRQFIRQKEFSRAKRYLLPKIYEYIRKHQLYQ